MDKLRILKYLKLSPKYVTCICYLFAVWNMKKRTCITVCVSIVDGFRIGILCCVLMFFLFFVIVAIATQWSIVCFCLFFCCVRTSSHGVVGYVKKIVTACLAPSWHLIKSKIAFGVGGGIACGYLFYICFISATAHAWHSHADFLASNDVRRVEHTYGIFYVNIHINMHSYITSTRKTQKKQ